LAIDGDPLASAYATKMERRPPPPKKPRSAQPADPRRSKPPAKPDKVAATPVAPASPPPPQYVVPASFEIDESRWASRGGLKLEAAVLAFSLRPFIENASCIDVGASTGGFTDVLLFNGARHVTAVDVGHDQMIPRLRNDARVTLLEKMHFKTASLSVAPGPFNFFVVDVSFMAARTVLKPLARRLALGAHGVVLVKPQFELPDSLVPKGGVVESRNLRKLAFNRFKKKVPMRGFELLGRINSPVAGAAGNIEFLAHLRYTGEVVGAPDGDSDD
jgi:23S rRNA (cytidine1920-2'-O)/16S rRNA (cytidine1409-2'-O)-methyltransferase